MCHYLQERKMVKQKFEKLMLKIESRLAFAAILFFVINMLVSCRVCDGPVTPGIGAEEPRIYFSSQSANGTFPAMFEISREGEYLREIISNAELFSAPSDSKWIAMLRRDSISGKKSIMRVSDQGGGLDLIEEDGIYDINHPVMSPNGERVALSAVGKRLFVYDFSALVPISNQLADSSEFKYSADGNYLAYYENLGGSLVLKIIDGINTDQITELASVDLSGFSKNSKILSLNWCKASPIVIFSVRKNDSDYVKTLDVQNNVTDIFSIYAGNLGAAQPDLSPDKKFVAFVSNSGQIVGANTDQGIPLISFITNNEGIEKYEFPEWSPDGNSIIFKGYASYDKSGMGSLNIANVRENGKLLETVEKLIISTNVIRGFWKQYKN